MTTPTLADFLRYTTRHLASDTHLSAGMPVAMRVDGKLVYCDLPPLTAGDLWAILSAHLNTQQQDELHRQKSLDFALELAGVGRFRANIFWQNRGVAAVFRHIKKEVPSLETLNLNDNIRQKLAELSTLKQGLVLVTGATGSGKSTTLAAMIDHINRTRQAHIITIEDPIEFVHTPKSALVHQRELHTDTPSFELALKAALREDPDVILVGELRDLESIRLALSAAETGHLVLATLHTMNAAKTIDRIIDVFGEHDKAMIRAMLSESLQAVISQTLLPQIGGGRVAAHELLIATPAVRHLIRENKLAQIQSTMQTGANDGMITLSSSLETLIKAGKISADDAKL
ncbi:twitching motility protein PilT [Moraxella caviae]|uniref:Twitching mobility protein n=1 Tax=Moraxella caviae TaxID=34060 RepID=A0A1T0ACN0_9GAMM|nr:type IV pilus twitching motility protein PilT [Moraxella caviae]OOR93440.1 twitching motility protein PilT [Moraxella caviae]STZ14099.1 Twitching mobility protein [Moraxella caviae]VEW13359.1 Twitching mobility protein [Moraxella caviae]